VLIFDGDDERSIQLNELSGDDREWIHSWMTRAKHNCPRCRDTFAIRCTNPACKNGKLYGPVSETSNINVGGRRDTVTISGRGAIGICGVCGGHGVVRCPDCRK
jgi:predicted RNA-binding Zn-ribbon protein involved in translation (DUF1610 family)